MTLKERLVKGLTDAGWQPSTDKHGVVKGYSHPNQKQLMFVGDNGSLRYGRSRSNSMSIGHAGSQSPMWLKFLAPDQSTKEQEIAELIG